ncbi:TPA: SH3 domain-containing protein, partial [Salmonella enterica subsp. enterica serovar Typhi]|nr:SH3 domain-containing protein [Salmonella enterica subsp. enterica serovar Typhi]HCS0466361.1 SH3 domain-containing protein [Salmonella enterica subsp. enterica serovar Typhi]
MMKEKKTLLNNNENGTGLPSKPSIMSENKLQNTVFSAIGSASPAHKLVQGSSAAAFLKNHESLLAGTAVSSAFATQKLAQGSSVAAFLKSHESLFASTAVSSAFAAQKLVQDSGITALFKKQGGIFNENYFATSIAKQLEKLDATEIQTLQEAAILFSRSPQGAA